MSVISCISSIRTGSGPGTHFGAIPWGRVGLPEEVASCIVFLASLDKLPETCTVWILPLPIAGGDGSPVRAVAEVAVPG
jgi:hypothetical protein